MYNLFTILLKEYEDIRVLSRRLYGSVLNKTGSNLTVEDARRARVVMDNYRIEETKASTLAATKMYKWVSQLI
jgi:hypothetical protein